MQEDKAMDEEETIDKIGIDLNQELIVYDGCIVHKSKR